MCQAAMLPTVCKSACRRIQFSQLGRGSSHRRWQVKLNTLGQACPSPHHETPERKFTMGKHHQRLPGFHLPSIYTKSARRRCVARGTQRNINVFPWITFNRNPELGQSRSFTNRPWWSVYDGVTRRQLRCSRAESFFTKSFKQYLHQI